MALTVDPIAGTEQRALAYTDNSEGGNNVYLHFYAPLLFDVQPNPARREQVVTLTGEGFGAEPLTEGRVTLNGLPLPIASWGDNTIRVTLAPAASSGPLIVEAQGVESEAIELEVLP